MSDNLKVALLTAAAIALAFVFVYLTTEPRLECGEWTDIGNGVKIKRLCDNAERDRNAPVLYYNPDTGKFQKEPPQKP